MNELKNRDRYFLILCLCLVEIHAMNAHNKFGSSQSVENVVH